MRSATVSPDSARLADYVVAAVAVVALAVSVAGLTRTPPRVETPAPAATRPTGMSVWRSVCFGILENFISPFQQNLSISYHYLKEYK